MTLYLWNFDAEGWPLERIDTFTGEHVPVFTGLHAELHHPKDGGRPLACSILKVSGVEWVSGGDYHPRKSGDVLGGCVGGAGGGGGSKTNDGTCSKSSHLSSLNQRLELSANSASRCCCIDVPIEMNMQLIFFVYTRLANMFRACSQKEVFVGIIQLRIKVFEDEIQEPHHMKRSSTRDTTSNSIKGHMTCRVTRLCVFRIEIKADWGAKNSLRTPVEVAYICQRLSKQKDFSVDIVRAWEIAESMFIDAAIASNISYLNKTGIK